MFVILAIVICILVAIIFAFYKKGDELAQYLPWLWKHIGQPLFNYLFVTSIRKVTIMGHRTKRILRIERKEYQTY